MLTKKAKELINETWGSISFKFNNQDWTKHGDNLLAASLEESKGHDRFRGDSIGRGMSIRDEAQFFAIKHLGDYLAGKTLDAASFISIQKSCFHAYSLVHDERFKKVWDKFTPETMAAIKEIASWDYCQLIASDMPETIEAAESHAKALDDKNKSLELANYVYSSYLRFIKELPANKKPKARLAPIV